MPIKNITLRGTTRRVEKSENKKIPKLRFPEFSGAWEEKRLGEVGEITSSKRVYLSDYVSTGIPFFRGKEITELKKGLVPSDILFIKESKFKEFKNKFGAPKIGDILITSVGTLGNVYRVAVDYDFYFKDGNLIWLKNPNINSNFLEKSLQYHYRDLLKGVIGSTQKALTIDGIKKMQILVPQKKEQQKIAGFLGGVDAWIENLRAEKEKMEEYKKGMMQKIFDPSCHSRGGGNPENCIRFKDDNGKKFPDWEEKGLGDCLEYEQPTDYIVESTEYNDDYKIPVLTAGKTFILGYTAETKGIFKKDLPVVIFDDFTTASQFVDFPFKVKSSAMKILKAKNKTDIKFLYEAMQMIDYKVGGHGRHWISKYLNIKILIPALKEQQKIAEFLTSLDNLIELKEKQITQAEQWKKGLMQGLFV